MEFSNTYISDSSEHTHTDYYSHGHGGDNDESNEVAAETSTINFEHEPFHTFREKVLQLAKNLFPHVMASKIEVEHMKGGSFNRVIGITIRAAPKKRFSLQWLQGQFQRCFAKRITKKTEQFVIRIPRYDDYGMDGIITMMNFVSPRLSVPVPVTTFFDLTGDNVLGKGYLVQRRLQGENLASLWEKLNLEQKLSAARQVIDLTLEIARITSPAAGTLIVNSLTPLHSAPKLETFSVPRADHETPDGFPYPHTSPAVPQTTLALLIEQGERWRQFQTADGACFDEIWDGFAKISNGLHRLGFLQDNVYRLCHGDLESYNVLAIVTSDTEVQITGILDWDTAVFAPSFMFRAPFWMWTDVDEDDWSEGTAAFEPLTQDGRKLKQLFMDKVDDQLKNYAFCPEYALARRMFLILQNGVFSDGEFMEAQAVIAEWEVLHSMGT